MRSLKELLDALAIESFGMTKAEALEKGICIKCKKPPTFSTDLGRDEYPRSGLCEPCFDAVTALEELGNG